VTLAARWRNDPHAMLVELVDDGAAREHALQLLQELAHAGGALSDATARLLNLGDEAGRNVRRLGWWSHFSRGRRAMEQRQELLLADAQRTAGECQERLGQLLGLRDAMQEQLQGLRQHGAALQLKCDIAGTLVTDALAARRLRDQLGETAWGQLLQRLDELREAEAELRLAAAHCSAAEAESGMLQDRFDDVHAVLQPLLQGRDAAAPRKAA
jgi:hypothetical protein